MQRFSPIRAAITMFAIVTCLVALIGRVIYLQTYGRQQTIRRAERQQHQYEPLYSRRGSIFDACGLLMAGTVQTTSLFIDPSFMAEWFDENGHTSADWRKAIASLARLIDKTPGELEKLLSDRSESRYVRVADNIDDQTRAAINKLDLPGVGFTPVNVRNYPMGSIAAHVLGGVGAEGKGLEGLELKFEKILAGRDGYKRAMKDARRRPIAVNAEDYLPPQNGQHLILTLDANMQMIAEQELAATCELFRTSKTTGSVVIMDPKTGEVLAMGNWPTFNPQNLIDSTGDMRRNRVLTDPYEPGSTLKPFVAGPAMAWRMTRHDEVFPIHGASYKSPLRSKLVTDVHGYDNLCLWDVLVKSSNIGMTMLGERMKKEGVYRALNMFHFGEQTGIELNGEDNGYLKATDKWANSDIVSAVQGYSVMVTPLQLVRGMAVYANGGRLVQPRVVKGVLDENGNTISRAVAPDLRMMPEVIDPMTAAQMRRILADVPVRGTATKARSKSWNIFGKTGTAHISRGGSYNEESYTSSFIGGAPYENPRLVIAMVIHDPDRSKAHYGGTVAAPGAARALERCLAYLQEPSSPRLEPPSPQVARLLWAFEPKLYTSNTASARE